VVPDQAGIDAAPMTWPGEAGQYVYLLDRKQGIVFRSDDYGSCGSWEPILDVPGLGLTTTTGFLVADPTTAGRLWLTTSERSGTYLITNAHTVGQYGITCPGTNCQQFSTPVSPGPVTVKPGTSTVFIAGRVSSGVDAALWRSTTLGVSWENLATTSYKGAAMFPLAVAATSDGYVYVATRGMGVIVVSGV
jgi:hypothetical protein